MNDLLDTPQRPDPAGVSNNSLAIRYGLIWAGISAVLTLVGFLTDTDPSNPASGMGVKFLYGIISLAVAVWAVVMAIKTDRDVQLGGFMSLGRSIGLGAKTGLVSGVVSGIFTVLYMTVINSGYTDAIKQAAMAEYERQGLSEEQIEMAMGMASKFMSPTFLGVTAVIGGIITGLIIGLVAGAIMKRD